MINSQDCPAHPFDQLRETIKKLRDPQTGCQWQLKQDHKSLIKYLIEEAYEASSALEKGHSEEIEDELGDVLFQIVLHGQIGVEQKNFSTLSIVEKLNQKLIHRHPHVFGSDKEREGNNLVDIKKNWAKVKQREREHSDLAKLPQNYFERHGAHKIHPASLQTEKIAELAEKINFHFKNTDQVWMQLLSEVDELKEAYQKNDREHLISELGDVFFTLTLFCQQIGKSAEWIAQKGNEKFLDRFSKVENLCESAHKSIESLSRDELESYWQQAKKIKE